MLHQTIKRLISFQIFAKVLKSNQAHYFVSHITSLKSRLSLLFNLFFYAIISAFVNSKTQWREVAGIIYLLETALFIY